MQRLGKPVMVMLWSSGFIVGTLATRRILALSATFWRFAAAAPVMALIAVGAGVRWPSRSELPYVVSVGVLLQAVQFSGIYLALAQGVPAGLLALLAGSSPVLVALASAALFDERLDRRQWIGSAIGVTGVVLAVDAEMQGTVTVAGFLFALLGLAGLTGGTLIQRHHGARVDARSANAVQLVAAMVVMVPVAALTDGFNVPLTFAALAPLAWLAFGLCIGAVLLYFWLLRREKGGEATSFLYLVPSVTAIAAVPTLGQSLSAGAVAGLALALIGVRMVSSGPALRARQRSRAGSHPRERRGLPAVLRG